MPAVIRLSQRLWLEYSRQVRGRGRRARRERQRETLILSHMDMVQRIAKTLGKLPWLRCVKLEELVADGHLGLCEAAVRYRPSRHKSFEHYAWFRIRGAILDPQRRQGMFERDGHESLQALQDEINQETRGGRYFLPHAGPHALAVARGMIDPALRPEAWTAGQQQRQQLRRAVAYLAEPERAVLNAHLAGHSLAAIAEDHGRGVMWARQQLAAAKSEVGRLVKGRAA